MAKSTTVRFNQACRDVAHWRRRLEVATAAARRAAERQFQAERSLTDAQRALRDATEVRIEEMT